MSKTFFILTTLICLFVTKVPADTISAFFPAEAKYSVIENRAVKIMPMGNSLTSALHQYCSYRCYLWNMLMENGFGETVDFVGRQNGVFEGGEPPSYCASFDMDHEGVPTITSQILLSSISSILADNIPDIVLLHIGTNDLAYGVPLSNSKINISGIIDSLRYYNPNIVILLSRLVPLASRIALIPPFNAMLMDLAVSKGSPVSPIVMIDNSIGFVSSDFHGDNVHLNDSGEVKFAKHWYQGLSVVLRNMKKNETIENDLQISPASGSILSTQTNDISFIIKRHPGVTVKHWAGRLDGTLMVFTGIQGITTDSCITMRLGKIKMGDHLTTGRHTFIGLAQLEDGTVLSSDTTKWDIYQTNE